MKRSVFYLSDRTGITAELLGQSLLAQFDTVKFHAQTIPYIDSVPKAHAAIEIINQSSDKGEQPLVFSTIVQPEIQEILHTSDALILDVFESFIAPLERTLGKHSSQRVGKKLSASNIDAYDSRIYSVNYALKTDDGMSTNKYDEANIILIGVSRCGKTPTALYLAMQFGILAANYPFVGEDLERATLPPYLLKHRNKLYGMTISPQRLHEIRTERRANSQYASLEQCEKEVAQIDRLFKNEHIPFIDTTARSIEEIATKIIAKSGLKRLHQ